MLGTVSRSVRPSIEEYKGTIGAIRERIAGLAEEQLVWKPDADQWSVKEIVAHLADSSLVHGVRVRKIVVETHPPLLQYDQDAWVASARSNEAAIEDILSAFEALLEHNASFYQRLGEEDWQRFALNDGKEVTVADVFQGFIRHVHTHLAQIDRTKAALTQQITGA